MRVHVVHLLLVFNRQVVRVVEAGQQHEISLQLHKLSTVQLHFDFLVLQSQIHLEVGLVEGESPQILVNVLHGAFEDLPASHPIPRCYPIQRVYFATTTMLLFGLVFKVLHSLLHVEGGIVSRQCVNIGVIPPKKHRAYETIYYLVHVDDGAGEVLLDCIA